MSMIEVLEVNISSYAGKASVLLRGPAREKSLFAAALSRRMSMLVAWQTTDRVASVVPMLREHFDIVVPREELTTTKGNGSIVSVATGDVVRFSLLGQVMVDGSLREQRVAVLDGMPVGRLVESLVDDMSVIATSHDESVRDYDYVVDLSTDKYTHVVTAALVKGRFGSANKKTARFDIVLGKGLVER